MKTRSLGILALVTAVGGCAHLSLKDKAVTSIRVPPFAVGLCPGQEAKIAVTAVLADGHEEATTGAGHGKVGWDNYKVILAGGTVKDGKVRLSSDPRVTWNKPGLLVVEATDHPGVQWTGEIAARYDCELHAGFWGASGSAGSSGSSGSDGDSPGGKGGDGGDGGDDADHGEDGQNVAVWLTTVVGPGQKTLVQAAVRGDATTAYYAFDPAGGKLTIHTGGGAGGNGGSGGNGGDGGKATKDEKQGRGGDGGKGGCGSYGGNGGDVRLRVDPSARPYLDRVIVDSSGGDSGGAGRGGIGGRGSPQGRSGKDGCAGDAGHSGDRETVDATVAPLW